MRQIDLDTPATSPTRQPARPRLRRRLAFTLVGALAAGAAVVGVPLYERATVVDVPLHEQAGSKPLNSSALASWTASPTHVDTSKGSGAATLKRCLDTMDGDDGPATITNADLRGKVTSMVIRRGGTNVLCYVAPENGVTWMQIGDTKPVAPDVITYETGSAIGADPDIFNQATGLAGSDVRSVTMTAQGRTFEVIVENGRWTAWWPGSPEDKGGVLDTATLTFTDGTTRTIPGPSL
ncbi:hypothetical protein [Streptomyces sp. NPDC051567]|uniref:hypothetical protein n=1 Tax=Streptomyces sp. NPDC051567 TaxID=3365660 RepID=UPI003792A094